MPAIQRWFGVLVVVAALHMVEQLITGLDELHMIRRVLSIYYRLFSNSEFATVLLVTIVVVIVLLLIYGVLLGGRPLLCAMTVFVLISISEVHHIIESAVQWRYVPGTITAVVWVAVGLMLGQAVLREARRSSQASVAAT
jgi:hypothetical protein